VTKNAESNGFINSSSDFNLIGDGSIFLRQGIPEGNNQVGTPGHPLNAKLAPLNYYGGPTQTMPPMSGSPAIDKGGTNLDNDASGRRLTIDQRGLAACGKSLAVHARVF